MLSVRDYLRRGLTGAILLCVFLPVTYNSARASSSDIPQIPDSAERGQVSKETAMGDAYLMGKGVPLNVKQAAFWYEKAAGLGDPVAQNQIGYLYQIGLGVEKDQVRAVHWYQLAAANGLSNAKVNLAVAYIWGMGTPKNPETGEKLLLEAAAKGNPMAATYLGDLHYLGVIQPKDEEAGIRWYEKGVKMHSYLAAYRMGMILLGENKHPQDLKRALSLLREAAAEGFVPAMHSAGLLLVNHPDLCTSHEEALTYLNDAAEAGTWQSSLVLGALSRDGRYVPQDDRDAYLHFRSGAIQGGETAKALVANDLQVLNKRLSAEDRARLDQQAESWANDHNQTLSRVYKPGKGYTGLGTVALVTPTPGSHAGTLRPFSAFERR